MLLFSEGFPEEILLVFRAQGCGLEAAGLNSFCQVLSMSRHHIMSHDPVHESPSFCAVTIQSVQRCVSNMHVIHHPTAG